ncbi:hypothetical protein TRICI_002692 [Trichomonascus ciferrii]|uniref:Uncharacterized protein n=1 Tax=Trichomonascus ciferrii TaxID=44093 RepID=A0A642V5Z0_9ASCO|nr:hypothetical protein TRICI_002692 [Trichomonascus ciferrii]
MGAYERFQQQQAQAAVPEPQFWNGSWDQVSSEPPPGSDQYGGEYGQPPAQQPLPNGHAPSNEYGDANLPQQSQVPSATSVRKDRPVLIPQCATGKEMPFCRAYSNGLGRFNITQRQFVQFLDVFNMIYTPHVTAELLKNTWEVMKDSPDPVTKLLGQGIFEILSKKYEGKMSKRTNLFTEFMNEQLFKPRGLNFSVVSSKDLAVKLHLPSRDLLGPITKEQFYLSVNERRVDALKAYVHPVNFEVGPPSKETAPGANAVAAGVAKKKNEEDDLANQRRKMIEKFEKEEQAKLKEQAKLDKDKVKLSSNMESYEKKLNKVNKKMGKKSDKMSDGSEVAQTAFQDKWNKKITDLEAKRQDAVKSHEKKESAFDKHNEKREKKEQKIAENDKERKLVQKLNWIFIEGA